MNNPRRFKYNLRKYIGSRLLKTLIFFEINIPFYPWYRRPLNKAVTPPWMNCTSETAQWGRQRTRGGLRARNRVCMQSHSRDRLGGGGGGGGASLQFRALARKPATPTPVVEVYAWWFPMLSSRRTWQKVGQSARCRGDRKRHGASESGGADDGRSFPTLLGPHSILRVRKGIDSKGTGRRRRGMITRVFLTQKARKPTPKYDEQRRAL